MEVNDKMYVKKSENRILIKHTEPKIGVECLICGESVELNEYELALTNYGKPVYKVCDKCKKAVLSVRKNMENLIVADDNIKIK